MKIVTMLDENGKDCGEHECQKCQLTGDYLYPTYYTEIPKPEVGKFKKARFIFELKNWLVEDCLIDKVLYHKVNRSPMVIKEETAKLSDYPEYTTSEIPEPQYAYYYDYVESTGWVFNLARYKSNACSRVTILCVNENYTIFPQHKRDNVYSGSPASDNYPAYLKGDAGKMSIAKLNAVYQQIAADAQMAIKSGIVKTRAEVDAIITALAFPTEAEILAQIQS